MAGLPQDVNHEIILMKKNKEEVERIKQQLKKEYEEKIEDLKNKFEGQTSTNTAHIKKREQEFQRQIKELKSKNTSINKKNEELNSRIKKQEKDYSTIIGELEKKDNCIDDLKASNNSLCENINGLQKLLKDKSEKFYKELTKRWEKDHEDYETEDLKLLIDIDEENEKIKNQDIEIKGKNEEIKKQEDKLSSLKKEEEVAQETIAKWNQQIDQYFENIDEKILNHRIESTLISKMGQSSLIGNGPQTTLTNNQLYVQQGYVKNDNEIEKCNNYEDYLKIADSNLDNVCVEKTPSNVVDCFAFALRAHLCPLLCGYGSQLIATALIAAVYAETPTIISVLPGFNALPQLIDEIKKAQTKTVIIADAFGQMNEAILFPLLRNKHDKKIFFIAENVKELHYTPISIYRYVNLIAFRGEKMRQEYQLYYSDSSAIIQKVELNPNGYKKYSNMLRKIRMDVAYTTIRKDIFNFSMLEEYGGFENSLKKYILTELQWIITDEQKKLLNEYCQDSGIPIKIPLEESRN